MQNLTLLEKYNNIESKTKAFIEIFNYFHEKYIKTQTPLNKSIIEELIELGDNCFKDKINHNLCKEEQFLYELYIDIKKRYEDYNNFETKSLNYLCELNHEQVKEVENLYEFLIINFLNSMDVRIQANLKDSSYYNEYFPNDFFLNNQNILKFKALLAISLKEDGILFIDYFDNKNKEILSTSIAFINEKINLLNKSYSKKYNKLVFVKNYKTKFIVFK